MISFKKWLTKENAQGASEPGNEIAPEDNGLKRPSYLHPAPISKQADKLFGIRRRHCKKKLKKR